MGSNNFEEWYYRFLKVKPLTLPKAKRKRSCWSMYETAKLLPDEGIDSLYKSEDCLLCADEKDIRKKSCYAQTDLGMSSRSTAKTRSILTYPQAHICL